MLEIILFIIASVSCSVVLARADILEEPKQFILKHLPTRLEVTIGSFMYCSQCIGFWVGIAMSLVLGTQMSEIPGVNALILGFVSSYFSSIGDRIVYGKSGGDEGS
jgi:hypothetical protein